jgi:hypothetical protein
MVCEATLHIKGLPAVLTTTGVSHKVSFGFSPNRRLAGLCLRQIVDEFFWINMAHAVGGCADEHCVAYKCSLLVSQLSAQAQLQTD